MHEKHLSVLAFHHSTVSIVEHDTKFKAIVDKFTDSIQVCLSEQLFEAFDLDISCDINDLICHFVFHQFNVFELQII